MTLTTVPIPGNTIDELAPFTASISSLKVDRNPAQGTDQLPPIY
jgi:hypothetical protein